MQPHERVFRIGSAILLGFQLAFWLIALPSAPRSDADFRHLYTAGYMMRTGQRHALYDVAQVVAQNAKLIGPGLTLPSNHLAYEILFYAPFSLLGYKPAYLCFLLVNLLILALAAYVLARMFPAAPVVLMCFSFPAVLESLYEGQDSILLLVIFCFALLTLTRKNEFWAGAVLGLGTFRFEILVPMGVLFLLWRRWRLSVGLTASALFAALASIALVGMDQTLTYVHLLRTNGSAVSQNIWLIVPGYMPNVRGLIFAAGTEHLNATQLNAATAFVSILILAWAAWKFRTADERTQFMVAILASALVSYHLFIHCWTIFLPVLAWAFSNRRALSLALVLFFTPFLPFLLGKDSFLACLSLIAFLWSLAQTQPQVGQQVEPSLDAKWNVVVETPRSC